MKYSPCAVPMMSSRQGILLDITADEILQIFGFGPNVDDDPFKVVHSWCVDVSEVPGMFNDDAFPIAVWDYKGSHHYGQFSVAGDPTILEMIFGSRYVNEMDGDRSIRPLYPYPIS